MTEQACTWTDEQTEYLSTAISKLGWRFKRPMSAEQIAEYLEDVSDIDFHLLAGGISAARKDRASMPQPKHLRVYSSEYARRVAYAKSQDAARTAEAHGETIEHACEVCEDSGWAHVPIDSASLTAIGPPANARTILGPKACRPCVCRATNPIYRAKVAGNSAAIGRTNRTSYEER
jgi:hypothetical protein